MIGHLWLYQRKLPSSPLPKFKLGPPIQKLPKEFDIFPAPNYKTQKKPSSSPKKYLCVCVCGGGGYSLGNQKWEIAEITIGIVFFAWDSKSPHLKCQFPPKIPIRNEKYLSLNLSKEPNFIFAFLVKSYTTFISPNFIRQVAQKTTLVLHRHDFSFFSQSQFQCGMLLSHTFDIIDLKTQGMGCLNSQPEGCDSGAVI